MHRTCGVRAMGTRTFNRIRRRYRQPDGNRSERQSRDLAGQPDRRDEGKNAARAHHSRFTIVSTDGPVKQPGHRFTVTGRGGSVRHGESLNFESSGSSLKLVLVVNGS